jgi:predicted HAD superfamily Cof-like phosphohydrolase
MSNFEKIVEFHKCFGLEYTTEPQFDVVTKKPELVKLRSNLIAEEVEEYNDAVKKDDFPEVIDALIDTLYVVYGACASYGIDADKAYDLVHKSNMSKLCMSEEEAQRTVESYQSDVRYDTPKYRKADDGEYWVVFNESTGKILKSINYKPVSFRSILEA